MERLLFLVVVAVMAPVIASFLSVVIHRLPREGMSIWRPARSQCPACGAALGPRDLAPILSWVASRGRCRHCGARVPFRYPLLELLLLGLWLAAAWRDGPTWLFARDALFLALLEVLVFIDLDTMTLPHRFTVAGVVSGLAFAAFGVGLEWPDALIGIVLGYFVPWILSGIYRLVRGQAGMGGGDFVLLAMIGAHTGPSGAVVAFLLAVLAGAVVGVAIIARRRGAEGARLAIPFGPFLALGGAVALFWGPAIVGAYLRTAGLQ
ncbi:MAG: prepilin peptidase [Candidatus Krumholzibacteriota bacterium]|nr:prepilin peptidase [Candidatus Krumholzibacteriota bacterium]